MYFLLLEKYFLKPYFLLYRDIILCIHNYFFNVVESGVKQHKPNPFDIVSVIEYISNKTLASWLCLCELTAKVLAISNT